MRVLATFLIVFVWLGLAAQRRVTGVVTDAEDGLPLSGVSAKLTDAGGKVRKFALTRGDGVFVLSFEPADSLNVELAKMGYAPVSLPVASIGEDTLRVSMEIKAVRLQEVGVSARRVREQGDTVTYTVGAFTRKQDRSIADVMNRMPGLEVDAGGKVQYQGTDINRLYVDGNDVAGGRYGMVTTNLDADNVGAVEVLENHQPMQVLHGISYSDRAAVNLKLKDKARIKVMGHGSAGGGYGRNPGGLYSGDFFAMSMRGSVQNITSLKLNNTGRALGSFSGYYDQDAAESLSRYISAGGVSGSGRSVFNRSASMSTSTSWKNRRGGQWRLLADYGYDHLWDDRSSTTTYYLPDGDRVIAEDRHADSHGHMASLSLNYELNERAYYISNNFNASGAWSDNVVDMTGTMPNSQRSRDYSYEIANRLKVIRRFGGNKIVTFSSVNQWLSRPERLTVDIAGDGDASHSYGSRVSQHAFFTDERASFGFIIGRIAVSMEAGVAAFLRHFESGMTGDVPVEGNDGNDMSTNYLRLFVQPKFNLNLRRVKLTLGVPVSYYSYFFGGALSNRNEFFVAPRLGVQWKPTSRHTVNFDASARRSPASLSNIFSNDILTDYRTFRAGIDDYYSSTGQQVGLRWEWRNTLRGWFANAGVTQRWNHEKVGVGQTVVGDYVLNTYHASPSSGESTDVSGRLSYSTDFLNSTVRLDAGYSRASGHYYSQGDPVERNSRSLRLGPSVDMQLLAWLNANYSFGFSRSSMRLTGLGTNDFDTYRHTFGVSATPGRWVFTVDGSHLRTELSPGRYDNRLTLNAEVRCSLNRRIDLMLNANNLTDSRYSVIRQFDNLSAYERFTRLRGREFLLTIRFAN